MADGSPVPSTRPHAPLNAAPTAGGASDGAAAGAASAAGAVVAATGGLSTDGLATGGRATGVRVTDGRAADKGATEVLARTRDAYVRLEADFRLVAVNPAAERALGRAAVDLLGRTHWEAFPASVGTPVEAAYRRLMAEGGEAHLTHHYVGEGYDRHLEIDAYGTVPSDAGPAAVDIFWRDITERVRAAEALQAAHAELEARTTQLRTTLDALPTLAWTARADGYIDWYNARWCAYTGTTPEQMEGWGWQRVHDPAVLPQVVARWTASIATGAPFEMTFPLRGADGVFRDFLTRVAPVRDDEGRVVRWVGTNTDLTPEREATRERERLLAEAQAARAELEAHALELELANQQLQEQAAELEATAEELQTTSAHLEEQIEAAERATQALRASEERYALAARATYNAIWDWDLATDALAWSPGIQGLFGHPPEAVPAGATPDGITFWYDHIHPDDRARVLASIHGAIDDPEGDTKGRTDWEEHYRFRRSDGSWAEVLDRGIVARDAAGRAYRMIGAMEDVTRQRVAERALAEQTRLLRTVAENATLALFVMDARQHCAYMNPAAERLTGFTLAELQGKPLHDWIHHTHPDGRPYPLSECPIDQAFPQNMREQGTETFVHKDGSFYPVAFTASPIRDEATGAPVGTIIEVRDIRAERAQAAERERLLVAERAARAAAETAQRAAEEASQAKSQFLATMSHELRTPLNAIGGYAQLLELELHGPITTEQRTALGRVQSAQRRLLALINDVLNFAKLESGKLEYDVQAVDAAAVVREVVPLVEPQFAMQGLTLTVTLPTAHGAPVACPVWADREKLGQVLVNLLSNAAKFTEPVDPRTGAPGRVTVDLARRAGYAPTSGEPTPDEPTPDEAAFADAASADVVFLRVRDTGVGIPREKQEAIFEPFVQVRSGYAQATEGTGLGLAISRDLARGMGGDLRVRSTPGEGSTFTVTLRRVVDAAGQPTDRRTHDERREGDERRGGHDRRQETSAERSGDERSGDERAGEALAGEEPA